ncbi:hypothetical protein D3C72_2228840 [compost metagenome]
MVAKEVTTGCLGFCSGRQSHSPSPVAIISPSESWTSGRKSSLRGWFSPKKNMLVKGAMPSVAMGLLPVLGRTKMRLRTVVVVCVPGWMSKR